MSTTLDRLAIVALIGAILGMPLIYDLMTRLWGSP